MEMSAADICSFLVEKNGISVDELETKPSEMMCDGTNSTKSMVEFMMLQEGISADDLKPSQDLSGKKEKEIEHLIISLEKIKGATNNFSDLCLIGKGGFGKVYKGEIDHSGGKRVVAIKRLDLKSGQQMLFQFREEVRILSKYKHTNLISLLGFCDDFGEKIIVYEYAPKRSLDRYLDSGELSWSRRLQICIDAAKGLQYLHDGLGQRQTLLHRDIKSANILLDDNWIAKISDFGLTTHSSSSPTPPTKKSDVYSFGVVLFEVLSGRFAYQDHITQPLVTLARQSYKQNRIPDIVFHDIKDQINPYSLHLFATIAYQCLDTKREERPTMSQLLTTIQTTQKFQETKPCSFFSVSPSHSAVSIHVSPLCHQFDFQELSLATNFFDESLIIGKGGSGKLYKGDVIIRSSKRVVAIKRLDPFSSQGAGGFYAELEMLSELRHSNIVPLIGYCNYGEEMILVYEYMPNGILADHLHKRITPLSWIQRIKICIGIARGLHYLQSGTGVEVGVIHRNLKSSSIMLNEKWVPKIGDFGFKRIEPTKYQSLNTVDTVKGTFEYLDPSYYQTGNLTMKSNVYSFGVISLEVLCGKRAVDRGRDEEVGDLASWAKGFIKKGKLKQICDSDISNQIAPKCLKEFGRIVERCLHHNPEERCTISEVLFSLESLLIIQEKYNYSLQPAGRRKFSKTVKNIIRTTLTVYSLLCS